MSEGLKMKYFVLKPDGDDQYAKASREAMRAYARIIKTENPALSRDLVEWAGSADPDRGRSDVEYKR